MKVRRKDKRFQKKEKPMIQVRDVKYRSLIIWKLFKMMENVTLKSEGELEL